ncbi:hypothetical protein ACA910_016730 [Epithemia clementina (nom. ined.)]
MHKYWDEGRDYKHKQHVPLTLVGRFKQTNGVTQTYIEPLTPQTSSGIEVQKWLGRTIKEYHLSGITSGPMFCAMGKNNQVKCATVSHLDDLFHDILKRVQLRHPEIIGPGIRVEDLYSIWPSLWHGATTKAQNRKIPESVIENNNRWKKHTQAHGVLPSMSMMERYTDVKASVKLIIQFSEQM